MPPDLAPTAMPVTAAAVDFVVRADPDALPEWMDEPCSYETFRDCVRELGRVNRLTLATRPTLAFLKRVAAQRGAGGEPLRILDVGFGGGDPLRRLARWAAKRKLPVELTGIDLNPYAARAAAEFTAERGHPAEMAIRWLTGDAMQLSPAKPYNVILSSLVTHHMRDGEIVRFLAWMEATAAAGWFVNDLRRSRRSYQVFSVLSRMLRWHRFVQHDGPVSIRRAFREDDWRRMLLAADVPPDAVELQDWKPGRLCVARVR